LKLKILKKVRAASPNSEFTGSYKKSVINHAETVFYKVGKLQNSAIVIT